MADDKIEIIAELDLQKTVAKINQDLKTISQNIKPLELNVNTNTESTEKVKKAVKDLSAQLDIIKNKATGSLGSLDKYFNSNTKAAEKFAPQLKQIRTELQNIINTNDLPSAQNSYKVVTSQITAMKGEVKSLGIEGQSWFANLENGVKRFLTAFSGVGVLTAAIAVGRQMYHQIVDIDTAMTNLKKVSDESNSTYSQFLTNAATQAKNLGSSISDLVNSTADFARLGYGLPDANKLAQIATMYKNVGDVDIETSTKDIVSAMKAFDVQADHAQSIIDKFNEIGNNFAVSSADLGTGLKNSASALATAGNSIDQSLALLTGTTEITQDASEAGNAIKVLSMRLRGAKTDLETMGESTDGLAESTSTLRKEIQGLTGVDIMENNNTFKSTYAIMSEISKVYDTLSDTSKASLLQIIAGKQRGNQVSALIENMAQAEKALNTSLNSNGSAQREQDKWMSSIDAKTKQFTASFQGLSETVVDSDAVKWFVDLGSSGVNAIDGLNKSLGTTPVLLSSITSVLSIFKKDAGLLNPINFKVGENGQLNFDSIFGNFSNSTNKINQALKQLKLDDADKWVTKFNNETKNGTQNVSKFMQTCTDPSFKNYVKTYEGGQATVAGYTKVTKEANAAIQAQSASSKIAAVSATALNVAMNVGIMFAVSAAIGFVATQIENLVNKQKDEIAAASELTTNYSSSVSSINSNISSLQSLQSEFSKLSKGVDDNGKNVGLSTDQYKRYHEIVKQIVDIQPSLIKGWDDEGNAIVNKNNALQSAITYEQQQLEIQKQTYLNSADKVITGAEDEVGQHTDEVKQHLQELSTEFGKSIVSSKEYAKALADSANSGSNDSSADVFKNISQTKFSDELKTFGISYDEILKGNSTELNKLVSQQDVIITKVKLQNGLTDEQKTNITNIVNLLSTSSNSLTTDYQKVIAIADAWSSLSQNSSWFDKINQSNGLDAFNKQIQKFVQNNPKATAGDIENEAYKIGQAFAQISNKIPTDAISDLKNKLANGKISAEDYNKALKDQVSKITDLEQKYPELSVLLTTLADNYSNYANTVEQSNSDTTMTLDELSKKYSDLNTKITDLQSIQDTYNQVGYVSADMLEKLTANNNELLKCVDIVNGKLVLNTQSMQDNADKIKAQMTATVQSTLASQIYGIMQDDVKTKTAEAGNATDTAKGQISSMDETMRNAAIGAQVLAGGYSAVKDAFKGIPASNTDSLSADAQAKIKAAIASAKSEIDTINKLKVGSPTADIKQQKADKSAAKSAETAANKAKQEAEKAKQAVKDVYDSELKKIENSEDEGLYKSKYDYYNALVKLKIKYAKNKNIDSDVLSDLDKKTREALKNYEQGNYDDSISELSYRESLGEVKSGSKEELKNLQEIYSNLTTNPLMALINDEKHRQEITQKIYENKKQSVENDLDDLKTQESLGTIQNGSIESINKLKQIKENIKNLGLNELDQKAKEIQVQEELNSETQTYNENQINAVDHLVNIGKLQGDSLEYIRKLQSLEKSLNLTLEQRQSLQEKIYSSEVSYIQQLESDLSDESIEGSYGYRIKAIQDQIDAINSQSDAESKALAVEKAKAAWEEAQNQKTVSVFEEGKGFVYTTDQDTITEKKQALADAQREEEIEKLTQQKNQIQSEENNMKSQLESSLKELEGTSNATWSKIQSQITKVIDNVDRVFKTHTSKTKTQYEEETNALNDSTDSQTTNYQTQIKNLQTFVPEIQAQNNLLVASYNGVTTALNNMAKAYANAEENRENANYRYYEYNKQLKKNGNTVKYASGTNYSIGGWVQTDEQGYEAKFAPTGGGKYTLMDEGTNIFTAAQTENLKMLSNVYNPQLDTLRQGLVTTTSSNITNRNISQQTNHNSYHIDKVEFPNVQSDINTIGNALENLPLYFSAKNIK
ncbi:phage tail tape measure protein [Caproiciproducens sp.]